MENDLENSGWKKEAPYIAGLDKGNPFGLPHRYFETLAERIEARVYLSELPEDQAGSFRVPPGYFDQLNERIQAKVQIEDLKVQVGEGGFVVPEKYFENLPNQIADKIDSNSSVRLVKLFQTNFFKYSAAACLVLMSGILLYLNNPVSESKKLAYTEAMTEQMLFDIDEDVIIEYVQDGSKDKNAEMISDQELEAYILNNFTQNDLTSE